MATGAGVGLAAATGALVVLVVLGLDIVNGLRGRVQSGGRGQTRGQEACEEDEVRNEVSTRSFRGRIRRQH